MEWSLPFRPRPLNEPSRLLRLPPEIRSLIFTFALISDRPLVAWRLDPFQRDSYQEATQPALTRVSRQVRLEALPIFYDCNPIVLRVNSNEPLRNAAFLHCIEEQFGKLHRLAVWMICHAPRNQEDRPGSGAISLSLQRIKPTSSWRATGDWRWVTVVRKPTKLEDEARILTAELESLLQKEPEILQTPDTIMGLIKDLAKYHDNLTLD